MGDDSDISRRDKRPYAPRGTTLPHLREWRERALLSQKALGKLAASDDGTPIHPVTISRIERGGIAEWDTVKRLARALKIDESWLIEKRLTRRPQK